MESAVDSCYTFLEECYTDLPRNNSLLKLHIHTYIHIYILQLVKRHRWKGTFPYNREKLGNPLPCGQPSVLFRALQLEPSLGGATETSGGHMSEHAILASPLTDICLRSVGGRLKSLPSHPRGSHSPGPASSPSRGSWCDGFRAPSASFVCEPFFQR